MKVKSVVDERGFVSYQSEDNYPLVTFEGTVSASNYLGVPTGSIPNIAAYNDTRTLHEPTITAGRGTSSPGQGPTYLVSGALLMLQFTPDITTDRTYRMFKIPTNYVSSPSIHVHWTKTGDQNEFGKNVRWRVGYTIYDGLTQDGSQPVSTVEVEDTYENSGSASRYVHRTPNVSLTGFIAGYYVSMYIEAISPTGSALVSEPGLVSMDLMYRAYINQGN